jgi:hypothetical protein
MSQRLQNKDAVAQWTRIWFEIRRLEVRTQPVFKSFSKISPENSGGAENSAEISGTDGINFFCYMYESSLRHPVWVPEINVKACNSVWSEDRQARECQCGWFLGVYKRVHQFCPFLGIPKGLKHIGNLSYWRDIY